MRGLKLFLKGLCMGSADIIPGISGGTIALILGIYEELVFSIRSIDLRIIPYSLMAILKSGYRRKVKEMFRSIRFDFLLPLLLGIITAFMILVRIISEILTIYRSQVYSFFLGLILSSALIIYLRMGKGKVKHLPLLVAGIVSAYLFLDLTGINLDHSLPVIFLSGVASICAMILPGISGAYILLFLGQYEYMIHALKNLNIPPLITYLAGAFLGIIAFSHVLSRLMKRYRKGVLSFLVGLMIGGLRSPISKIDGINVYTAIPFILALLLVISIELLARRRIE
ncbi:MAG TPA: DUF368 domain-containing protein [Thermoplasmatales archaeon]|nr:DUF368 domain-containing protein [Thermoplasmatales archaeon]HEX17160.1 DUF368 domain-containing protein [Thermoplasmatales archaeon]